MKKIVSAFLMLFLLLSFVSCGQSATRADDGRLSVVATIFPVYDWAKNILGESSDAELTLLLDSGVDLHSYQPTADDLLKISSCDIFIYVGGESDDWVGDVMKTLSGKKPVSLNLMEILGDDVKEEEIAEGMQTDGHDHAEDDHAEDDHAEDDHAEDDHAEDDHRGGDGHDHADGVENDEHIWLSPVNAEKCAMAIADALCDADPDKAENYKKYVGDYVSKLTELDGEYRDAVTSAKGNTVLFADRFPFRYLTDEYGIEYYAAFSGCSAESEASFETVSFLSAKVKELGLKYVFALENTSHSLAETVIKNSGTDAEILKVDSMQSVTKTDAENGADYIDIMRKNLTAFKKALN